MDNRTLMITTALIAFSYAVLFLVLSIKRKEKDFFFYFVGFSFGSIATGLSYFQGVWNEWLTIILLNFAYFGFVFFMTSGLKIFFGLKPFRTRFILYYAVGMFLMVVFTFVYPHFSIRVLVNSIFTLTVITDHLVCTLIKYKNSHSTDVFASYGLIGGYMVMTLVRILFALLDFKAVGTLTTQSLYSTLGTLIFFLVVNFWAFYILISDYRSLLINLKQSNDELTRLAVKDTLTGLNNRRSMDEGVNRFLNIAQAYKQEISFIMLDLDNFKLVNDIYGHDYGDLVLKGVADSITSSIRKSDISYRWGGEEFLIVLPNTDLSTAYEVAEALRLDVKSRLTTPSSQLTISLGVTDYASTDGPNLWFRRADYALNLAKKQGKDRAVTWSSEKSLPLAFAKIDWNKSWECGHKELDRQHRELIDLSNALAVLGTDPINEDLIIKQLDTIILHTVNHFNYEEELLKSLDYEDYDAHRKEHADLVERFTALVRETKDHKVSIKSCFDQFAGTLIIGHLLHYDRLFFPLIASSLN